ncbi:MAG TPA: hypothetical protein P5136_03845 [Methanofastidiosum sp.]|nr:hypothetical protein [Methanofastidiosum sp.]
MKNPFSKLFELKLEKRQIIIISIIIAALIIIPLTIYFILRGKDSSTLINNNAENTFQEGYADDSESALTTLAQPYDTEDSDPTYDLYAEVGTFSEDATHSTVQTSSDFGSDSEECSTFEEGSCIDLGREKTVMPNHSTVNLIVWGSYATEWSDEGLPGARVGLKAYAVLPDVSMASIYSDTKVQFNFYDKETRIVQMEGEVYYRVKPQEDGHVFTVQAGDRLIELNDTEAYIQVEIDNDEMMAKYEERGKFEFDSDYVNDPYITQEEYIRRSEEIEKKMEEYNRESEEYSKNIYAVKVYTTSGSAKMYSRSDRNTVLYELTGDNPFTIFKYREYDRMNAYEAKQEEIDEWKEILATGYESTEFMANLTFSMSNYGMGNFAEVSSEDLVNMLQINIDAIEPQARKTTAWFKADMENFLSDWNEFISKTSCKPGWYQATSDKCCPDGYRWDSSRQSCTKTTYTYYCEDGYTLGSDNMCHKSGSTSESLKPTVGNTPAFSSGDCPPAGDIVITWCYPEDGSGYVFCGYNIVNNKEKYCQDTVLGGVKMVCGNVGDGEIPKKCLPTGFSNWVNP